MRDVALAGVLLCLALPSAWGQTQPLSYQDLDGLRSPAYSVASVEALIRRDVRQTEELNREIEKDLEGDAKQAPLWWGATKLYPPLEAPEWCKDAATAMSVANKVHDIDVLHDNVIQLEHVVWDKDPSQNKREYWRFIHTRLMADYHNLKIKRSVKKACEPQQPPPPVSTCTLNPFEAFSPGVNGLSTFAQNCLR